MLKIGENYSNQESCNEFGCSPQGGIRSVRDKNTEERTDIILISNHVKSIYNDQWINSILHYTGEGQEGDQVIKRGNKALLETLQGVNDTNPTIHLFEVFKEKQHTYNGPVKVIDSDESQQLDKNGVFRKVLIFKLEPLQAVPYQQIKKTIKGLNNSELKWLANKKDKKTSKTVVKTTAFTRYPWIVEYTKRRANGSCELCGEKAPFNDKNGDPFLEVHHIDWLSRGGNDSIDNAVALCPNCHRKMHILDLKSDVDKLKGLKK